MTKTRFLITSTAAVAALVLLAAGCSQKYSAERDGKKLGEAVCDLREAASPEDAESALEEINDQLEDLGNKYALFTAEDRQDVQNNLADLHEHAIQGNTTLMQQDLAVLERSIDNISSDSNEVTRAAWEGVLEGLADCTQ
jgi:ABC-type phosphate/phosphonate transport system substrate-binding protein